MINKFASQIGSSLWEAGKAVKKQASQISPGKILGTASNQLGITKPVKSQGLGKGPLGQAREGEVETLDKSAGDRGLSTESLKGSGLNPEQLTNLKYKEARKTEEGLATTRAKLERVKIQRYQELEQKILAEHHKKAQEIPAYEAGKPGAARTQEEKIKQIGEEKEKREKEEKEREKIMPTSKKSGGLSIFAKQKKGSREMIKTKAG
ncbi:hypothetical protein COT75_03390 [Candidatus Beckwithbacteria bacterium CG10_big_fil_rev_8_21_14_0_10_34_10]|uniref:Uncharacterized protein n=1 Tax=Candidatus Beckwithbacteria bacterium CG10_big_fil_rev_8_21_14_0_10_34_10 TaxID=1974495 RepID=A0A2H0W8U6_9BACT|nr:MAG: hypothetical protein COT75_03390 [Candidatus Beckwithbacteria bacterium CG10_big_fil_rev_8_21_14_0_10_34_10]